jgi:hypothetical protein
LYINARFFAVKLVADLGTIRALNRYVLEAYFCGARVVVIDKELERCFFTAGGTL